MRRFLSSIRFAFAFALLAPAAAHAQPATDADVLVARDAATRANWRALDVMRQKFAGHPLEAYPTYWLLAGSVERADPAEIRAFLTRFAKSPLAEPMRREWLRALGAAGAWDTFRAEQRHLLADDGEVTCYAFQERIARGDAEVWGEVRAFFVSRLEAPAACGPVFAAAVAGGHVSEPETWARIRNLLAAGHIKDAKRANALLASRLRLDERALERASQQPAAFLASERSTSLPRGAKELVRHAIGRLARSKPQEAAEHLALFAGRLGTEAQGAWGEVAWQAALAHHSQALEWYARAGDASLNDTQLAWRARAALRAGDWKEVLGSIQKLSPEEARESAWRYWRARALRELGVAEAAKALLQGLAGEPHFYGLLAAEELGVTRAPDWSGWHPATEDVERVRGIEGIQRALILYRLGLDNEALREWQWALRNLDDRDLLAAAEVARQANVPDRAINTAERTVELHDFSRRYPIPHREALVAAARQWDLDEAMVYSIIRQESRFLPHARSRVGATGLMQLMPATAKWVATKIPVHTYRQDMLVHPAVNIQMGSYYFRRLLSDLGHPILAAAGYNSGPGRARRWRDERAMEGAIYAETIPFNETRDYVKKVFANAWFYHHRLTGQPASLRQLLGMVPGRGASVLPGAAVAAKHP